MTAQMAAMMGVEATMVGCLGQDSIAADTLKHMQDLGIQTELIASTSEAASGVASIMTSTVGVHSCMYA
jgi:sugar/nucleoside kinase (ribokinase family)